MREKQVSVVLDRKTKTRLRTAAGKKEMTISQLTRELISEGLDLMGGVNVAINGDVLEEILVTIYGVEEMVVRGFLDPTVSPKADDKTRLKILYSVDSNARNKAKKLLGRVRK